MTLKKYFFHIRWSGVDARTMIAKRDGSPCTLEATRADTFGTLSSRTALRWHRDDDA